MPVALQTRASLAAVRMYRFAITTYKSSTAKVGYICRFNHITPGLRPHVDYKYIKDNAEAIASNITNRKSRGNVKRVIELYDQHVSLQHQLDELRRRRNEIAKSNQSVAEKQEAGKALKEQVAALESQVIPLKHQLDVEALQLPCETHPDAPVGPEDAAVCLKVVGKPRQFDFAPRDHIALGTKLGLFDLTSGPAIAGTGFMVMRNDGVLLEQALINWAINRALASGFAPIAPPDLAFSWLVEGCGFNPRDAYADDQSSVVQSSQVYSVKNTDLCLIGTSEIALAGLHANSIVDFNELPATYCAISHCFRKEAGSHGQRDKGLYRLHQFSKVELFAYVNPEAAVDELDQSAQRFVEIPTTAHSSVASRNSEAMFNKLVNLQACMLDELGLHFRVLDMPTEELGASAYRKIDMEAWMPCRTHGASVGAFGELTSASNCIDYQARRLNIRYKSASKENRFLHTLNATACAVPRTILAILETHQQRDGTVRIPSALQPYMGGKTELKPRGNLKLE